MEYFVLRMPVSVCARSCPRTECKFLGIMQRISPRKCRQMKAAAAEAAAKTKHSRDCQSLCWTMFRGFLFMGVCVRKHHYQSATRRAPSTSSAYPQTFCSNQNDQNGTRNIFASLKRNRVRIYLHNDKSAHSTFKYISRCVFSILLGPLSAAVARLRQLLVQYDSIRCKSEKRKPIQHNIFMRFLCKPS